MPNCGLYDGSWNCHNDSKDGEAHGSPTAANGTVHTMTAAPVSEPMDLYNASVAGVMLVGAVFACGVVLALSYFLWQACIIAADATIDALTTILNLDDMPSINL